MKAYSPRFLAGFWTVMALLVLTGLALLPGMIRFRLGWEAPDRWLPGARSLWAAGHGLLAMAGLIVFGGLVPLHVRHGLRQLRNRATGISLLAVVAVITLSGWGIYYLIDEVWLRRSSVVHVVMALLLVLLLAAHAWFAHRIHNTFHNRHVV